MGCNSSSVRKGLSILYTILQWRLHTPHESRCSPLFMLIMSKRYPRDFSLMLSRHLENVLSATLIFFGGWGLKGEGIEQFTLQWWLNTPHPWAPMLVIVHVKYFKETPRWLSITVMLSRPWHWESPVSDTDIFWLNTDIFWLNVNFPVWRVIPSHLHGHL